jgi:ParB family chromosome partitioning protein
VDGHRRLAAAREAGLKEIKYSLDDAFAASDEGLLEAAYVANAHRENMTELEEAAALERLVAFYGSQRKAAQRLGITQGFISQRLSLINLDPALQADLAAGHRKVEHVRGLSKLPPQQQRDKADARAEEAERKTAPKTPQKPPAKPREPETEGDYGVITPPAPPAPTPASEAGADATDYGVITEDTDEREGVTDQVLVKWMPFHDPTAVLRILRARMTPENFQQLAKKAQA